MNNGNYIENNSVPTVVRNTLLGANNGVNRPNGVAGNASQNQIHVPESEDFTRKRQATVDLEGGRPKVPKHTDKVQPSNGSCLQQGSVEPSSPNSVSGNTGHYNQFSTKNGFNGYSSNGFCNNVSGPNFVNNPHGLALGFTNNSYPYGMNNNGYSAITGIIEF